MKPLRILNGEFLPMSLLDTVDAVFAMIAAGERGYLCTVNVAILMGMRSDSFLQRFVERARFVVADGQPLIWASHALGCPLPERVTGVDLVDSLCERAVSQGASVYLLGATGDVVGEAARRLEQDHPGLQLAGVQDGYFEAGEAPERAQAIARSNADILIVGMGVPRQESFIDEQWGALGVPFVIGVGGSFDVIAGLRRRAPLLVQRIGFEWLFRLVQEPRRLFIRYFVTNIQFMALMSRELLLRPFRGSEVGRGERG